MPACDLTLYAKWDTMTYFLRFDWDGNVPLRDWLLEMAASCSRLRTMRKWCV